MKTERQISKRGRKPYIDYLQMWRGKNMISVYSPHTVKCAAVSMPVTWDELKIVISMCEFDLNNTAGRQKEKGDLFKKPLQENSSSSAIDEIIKNAKP
jgi:bifunctional non-homologous end joining protein LigD